MENQMQQQPQPHEEVGAVAKKRPEPRAFGSPRKRGSRVRERFIDVLLWIVGCLLYAVAMNVFNVPNHIAPGGVSGLATLLNYLIHTPVGVMVLIINIPIFLVAWRFLGWRFLLNSMIVTVLLSVSIDVTALFLPAYQGDRLLAALFGGVLSGAGMALIFIRGATTGGVDIISRLLRQKWPHLPMGQLIMFCDLVVVVAAWLVYGNMESALYATIVIFVSGQVIDHIMYGTGNGKMLFVVTTHAREIAGAVTKEMHRGVSILPVRGGYTGEDKNMLICAVRSSEVARLGRIIRRIDPAPFIVVAEAGEILGEGFKMGEDPV
ncbi:MAG TPA: YitT family protein [Candidatus Fimivicinus intestinavium]|nr:YitT family protein [Candidatus Fimivicinus intestinavium]